MKRLRYKTKSELYISLDDLPQEFTPTHVYTYSIENGKLKPHKHKLTKTEIKKLKSEREEI